jgi:hypothetical protein
MCIVCGKKQTRPLASTLEVVASHEAQELIDQMSRLKALPGQANERLVEELRDIRERLRLQSKNDHVVRRMFIKSQVRLPVVCILATYRGTCAGCRSEQSRGDPVGYDTEQRKIYCYLCVPESLPSGYR